MAISSVPLTTFPMFNAFKHKETQTIRTRTYAKVGLGSCQSKRNIINFQSRACPPARPCAVPTARPCTHIVHTSIRTSVRPSVLPFVLRSNVTRSSMFACLHNDGRGTVRKELRSTTMAELEPSSLCREDDSSSNSYMRDGVSSSLPCVSPGRPSSICTKRSVHIIPQREREGERRCPITPTCKKLEFQIRNR